jgi:hypothetical protein
MPLQNAIYRLFQLLCLLRGIGVGILVYLDGKLGEFIERRLCRHFKCHEKYRNQAKPSPSAIIMDDKTEHCSPS